jgi:hypothetical protein
MAALTAVGILIAFPARAQNLADDALTTAPVPARSLNIRSASSRPSFGFSLHDVDSSIPGQIAPTGVGRDFAIGYEWRNLDLKRTAHLSMATEPSQTGRRKHSWTDSRRLSFSASPNWIWRVGRDTLGDVDQLANVNTRRSTISATYIQPLEAGDWQTTLAWGRRARRWNEPMTGYLIESIVRFRNSHAIFGTLEQVGSDDPARANAPSHQQFFKMNKLTVGYFHHVDMVAPARIDVGGFVSLHLVPSDRSASYGSTPTTYMMFVRVKLD